MKRSLFASFVLASIAVVVGAGCSSSKSSSNTDAPTQHMDAPPQGSDGPGSGSGSDGPDTTPDGIAGAKASADGTGLALVIHKVTVTYIKPVAGAPSNDPTGFTIQAEQTGPGLFIAVDPATLTPPPVIGDVVNFTITDMLTVASEHRATAVTGFTRVSQGADVAALARDVSAATDLVSAIDAYDATLVNVTATLAANPAGSGNSFKAVAIGTTGLPADPKLVLRGPTAIVDGADMAMACSITATHIPVGRFNDTAELGVYYATDFALTTCPAPTVVSIVPATATSAKVTFSRHVAAGSVTASGAQFVFTGGLTVSAATASGKTVMLTTSAQTEDTAYDLTATQTITDTQGTVLATPNTGTLYGFGVMATVKINEINANITGGCDLVELRAQTDGSMTHFALTERSGSVAANELNYQFPVGFKVLKNDLVIVHMNSASTTCNPAGLGTMETTAKNQQLAALVTNNYDTAWDFYAADTGLTATDNVLTLLDGTTAIVDAVFLSNGAVTAGLPASGTEVGAEAAVAASQWTPAPVTGNYGATTGEWAAASVGGLNTTGTAKTGNSLQRTTNTDTNALGDWAAAASTFGVINDGEVAF